MALIHLSQAMVVKVSVDTEKLMNAVSEPQLDCVVVKTAEL